MATFDVPASPTIYTENLGDFLGVDFTSIEPHIRRASNMINMVNNDGFLETRPGYDVIGHEFGVAAKLVTSNITFTAIRKGSSGNDISITFVNPNKTNNKLKLEVTDKHLVYYLATDNTGAIISTYEDISKLENYYVTYNATYPDSIVEPTDELYLSGGIDNRINGIWNIDKKGGEYFVVHVKDKLYLLDKDFSNPVNITPSEGISDIISQGVYMNNMLLIFDGKRTVVYGILDGDEWQIKYVDEVAYIPTVSISREPDGTGASSYEDVNLLTPYRYNSFVTDGTSTTYKLIEPFDDVAPTAEIINQTTGIKQNLPIKVYDYKAGTVTFATAPPKFSVEGRDSLFIKYKVTNLENLSYVNKCKIVTTYGYNSNNTRLFVTGNDEFPNIDWFSEQNNPLFFPAENYTRIGFQPITNYLKLNDGTLAIQKKISDTDFSIYYRDSVIYNGKQAFPIKAGAKTIGCISAYANCNLLNDPLTLTESGVFGMTGSSYGEKFANERSYFVKNKLLAEPNLENATAIVYHDKYYLAINNHVYVADGRYKSKVDGAKSSTYQYEWYYWENVPVRTWFVYNDELYFTTVAGDIVKFNDTVLDYNIPIVQLFDTAFLHLNSIVQSKTIKRVTVISRPFEDTKYTLSYITLDDTQDIITKDNPKGNFPSTLQEKEKIKKFMFVKFRLFNDTNEKMNFYRIGLEYIYSGRYRGE